MVQYGERPLSHASRTMASLTLLTGFVVANTAFASPIISERDRDNYCRHYANMAVKDQEANEKFGCGYKGPAWHLNFGAHYGWCMRLTDVAGTKTPDAQQGVERHSMLTHCICYQYAREAVIAAKKNVTMGCGLWGPRWVTSQQLHYGWCTHLPEGTTTHISEAQGRTEDLRRCAIRKGVRTRPKFLGR